MQLALINKHLSNSCLIFAHRRAQYVHCYPCWCSYMCIIPKNSLIPKSEHCSDSLSKMKLLMVFVVLAVQSCLAQASSTKSTKYERVTVESNSFTSIRTTHLGAGWELKLHSLLKYWSKFRILLPDLMCSVHLSAPLIPTVSPTTLRHHSVMRLQPLTW